MADNVYLADCPFCAGLAEKDEYDPFDGYQGINTVYRVKCCKCGAEVCGSTYDEAVRKWNSRAANLYAAKLQMGTPYGSALCEAPAMTARELFNSYRRICEEYSRKGKIRCYDECPLYSVCPEIGKALRVVDIWAYVIETWTRAHPEERSED